MTKRNKILLGIFILVDLLLVVFAFWQILGPNLFFPNLALLNPKGQIAVKQLDLLITATSIMLVVIIPVFILTGFIVWKYRAGAKPATYKPNAQSNFYIGSILWVISIVVISFISVLTWKSSHELDPYKKIDSKVKPITIQVISLNWKWLFIYPEQNIATVNFIEIPEKTPIVFSLTSEGPMNSFWVPQLGGQAYAMAGMENKLHLIADEMGEFFGTPAEINGKGFSEMNFKVKAVSNSEFQDWVKTVKTTPTKLNIDTYIDLVKESIKNPVAYYSWVDKGLFNSVMMKYMVPSHVEQTNNSMTEMEH